MKDENEMDLRLNLPPGARLLLLGNVALVASALLPTVRILNNLDFNDADFRWSVLTVYRAPFLGVFLLLILFLIIETWRGSRRAANWMLALFSIFVGMCIWESARTVGMLEHSDRDLKEILRDSWWSIAQGVLGCVWLGLIVWYFYGRWGMVPRTSKDRL